MNLSKLDLISPQKRIFDIVLSFFAAIMLSPLFFLIAILVKLTSRGQCIYWSDRVGRDNFIFKMPKFRTMKLGAPVIATHLLQDSSSLITPVGSLLRRYSLDELPQLWSIFVGDMSFVGPRPALFNQNDLIVLRAKFGIDKLVPGLTGWAQVNGRDELSITVKVQYDLEYLKRHSFLFDIKILILTFLRVLCRNGVSH